MKRLIYDNPIRKISSGTRKIGIRIEKGSGKMKRINRKYGIPFCMPRYIYALPALVIPYIYGTMSKNCESVLVNIPLFNTILTMNTYQRRIGNQVITSNNPADVWIDWKPNNRETWLFVAPHDDDIILGAGLTFLAALSDGINVHAVVTTTGESGYCRLEHKNKVGDIRRQEAIASFDALGLPAENLHFLGYHDSGLDHFTGHFPVTQPGPTVIEGATGLENSYTWILRKIRPTRIFIPSVTDIHPDHRTVHNEMVISVFHAQGGIWPELGTPIENFPYLYEYATYSDFITPPDMRITVPELLLEKKLAGIAAYKSQEQIGALIEIQRQAGCKEVIRQKIFDLITPGKYNSLFD